MSAPDRSSARVEKDQRPLRAVLVAPPAGLATAAWENVPLSDIDDSDLSFQYRCRTQVASLRASLEAEGQREPIDLIGKKPYRIIDGFRRVLSATALGWPTIKAFVHRGLSDDEAYGIAFTKNVVRRNLTPPERAQAMVVAMKRRGLKEADLATAFGLSQKQIERYLKLLDFPKPILRILDGQVVTMAHAKVLATFAVADEAAKWRSRIEADRLDARSLKQLLVKEKGRKVPGRPRTYMRRIGNRVQVYPFTIGKDSPKEEREKVVRLLQEAIDVLKA